MCTDTTSPDYHKRAEADYLQSSQHLRAGLQLLFAGNGAAALAMLSSITAISTAKDLNPVVSVHLLYARFAFSGLLYLGGTICAVLALWAASVSKEYWGHHWENVAIGGSPEAQVRYGRRGEVFVNVTRMVAALGVLAFAAGSVVALSAFVGT
ncbi:MAG: hypothetical protein KGJ32_15075 [Xanthomonadaceae bacterium]|nr:hypothetical protein [Xanthomonadaceae bacterium]